MKQKAWGPEIWDDKNRHHDDKGVVLGTGFSQNDLDRNTTRTLQIMDRLFLKGLPKNSTLLDLGIGPSARFSLALARRGYLLTGVDGSREALKRAAAHAKAANVAVELIEADIANFHLDRQFDGIFCVETFFHLPAHLSLLTFNSINKSLKPQGKLLIQFAVVNEITPLFLLKSLLYMSAYKLLKPIFQLLGKKTFYVTVTRSTDQEIHDISTMSGFKVLKEEQGYYLFEKVSDPSLQISTHPQSLKPNAQAF